jgi:outer membrane protein
MKSYRAFLIALFSLFCVILNAQYFAGGSISLNTFGGTYDNGTTKTDKTSSFGFNISPRIGKFVSEKIAIGVGLDLSYNKQKEARDPERISRSSYIGFIPFLRYYAVKVNKFSIYGQGNLGLSFSNSSVKEGATTTDGPKISGLGLNIFPALSYDLSDKFSLETTLNFLKLGYNYSTSKTGSIKDHSSEFAFYGRSTIIAELGTISIGAIYKF